MIRIASAGGVAFLLSTALTRAVLLHPNLSNRFIVPPATDRWHTMPTPSFGGVPMFIAFVFTLVVSDGLGDSVARSMLVGAGIVFAAGLADDLLDTSPSYKLIAQFAGALTLTLMAQGVHQLSLPHLVLAVLLIVLISNSVNLLDNMDGLAGSTTLVSLVIVLPLVASAGQDGLALVSAVTAASVFGFLLFNVSPAKVFMGDAGSLWLGLIVAGTVALADYGDRRLVPIVAMTILAIPLIDTGTVILSRLRHGLSIMRGGRDHLSHRLARLGLTDKQTVGVMTAAAAICGLTALGEPFLSTPIWLGAIVVLWVCLAGLVTASLRIPVYQE